MKIMKFPYFPGIWPPWLRRPVPKRQVDGQSSCRTSRTGSRSRVMSDDFFQVGAGARYRPAIRPEDMVDEEKDMVDGDEKS